MERTAESGDTLVAPRRTPITVQIYETDVLEEIMPPEPARHDAPVYRPSLPITYMDRETLERMR